jgi:hypothetical protein
MSLSLMLGSVSLFIIACSSIYLCNQQISLSAATLTPRDKTILAESRFKSEYFIVNALYVFTVMYAITYRVYLYAFLMGTTTESGLMFFTEHCYATIILNLILILPLCLLQFYYLISTYRYIKHTTINQHYLSQMKLFNIVMIFYIVALLVMLVLPDYGYLTF